ncbi:MAG: branched-chain amino acid ABC transporter permease [Halobacteriales archaeon]
MVIADAVEILIDGVTRGVILSLFGLSITLVFGLGGILNLLIGVFAVVAVITTTLIMGYGLGLPVAALGGIGFASAFALATDRSVISLVYRSEDQERILLGIFVTLGLSITSEGLLYIYFPGSYFLAPDVPSVTLAGVNVTGPSLAVLVFAVFVLGLVYYFFTRTYLGIISRTVIQDETGAVLCGIRPRRIQTIIFVLSAAIAAIAGILYSFDAEVTPASAFELTIFAIVVAIVGGVDDVSGTVVAGIALGVVLTVAGALVGSYLAIVIFFAVAIAVLVYKPEQIA